MRGGEEDQPENSPIANKHLKGQVEGKKKGKASKRCPSQGKEKAGGTATREAANGPHAVKRRLNLHQSSEKTGGESKIRKESKNLLRPVDLGKRCPRLRLKRVYSALL